MAYSAGFNPHPKVSYVGASPTGVASEAEYLEIAVAHRCDPRRLRETLDASLPPGLDVLEVVEARTGNLAERVDASRWELRLTGVAPDVAVAAVQTFLAADRVEVVRLLKDGRRTLDARSPVISLGVVDGVEEPACAILQMVVRHVTPAVRPDDVLTGLREVADLVPPVPTLVTRLAQGLLDEETGQIADPLAPDREAAVAAMAAPETP
jgi:radical SAM-linked protein